MRNPLTLEAVIAWAEKQPADKTYSYANCRTCFAARYNASIGREYWMAHMAGYLAPGPFDLVLETIASGYPYTYGAALKRARRAVELS